MTLYHGSYTEIKTPELQYSRYNLDFGKGFYLTGLVTQAEKWALRRVAMAKLLHNTQNAKPIVSVYELNVAGADLKIRSFDGYTEECLDFVVKNRGQKRPTAECEYDIVFGNVADDDVAAVVDDYMRLLSKGRIDPESKQFFLRQLQFSEPNDQYCIASGSAINRLAFIKSYRLGD